MTIDRFKSAAHSPNSPLIPLTQDDDGITAVMGRDLHAFLEVGQDYTSWFKRMESYGFIAGQDYLPKISEVARQGRGTVNRTYEQTDHIMSMDMAKEVAMIQRTAKGKAARQYFIEVEKAHRAAETAQPSRRTAGGRGHVSEVIPAEVVMCPGWAGYPRRREGLSVTLSTFLPVPPVWGDFSTPVLPPLDQLPQLRIVLIPR